MTIFYYTATGNSLSVAKRIGGNLISIPQIIEHETLYCRDTVVGLVFPIYGLVPPKMVRRFLERIAVGADYTFAIGTCGYSAGAAMMNLQERIQHNGFKPDYVNELLMVDNCIPTYDINEEIKHLHNKKTEEHLAVIINDIRTRKHRTEQVSESWIKITKERIETGNVTPDDFSKNYIVETSCIKCGICSKVCPAGNITVTDKVIFSNHCERCEACLHLCPQNAIHINGEKSTVRWKNPDVSLQEIISSNNRLR